MDLKELYRDVILDHNRSPRNFGRLEPADAQAAGHNPLCGDILTLTLRMQGDRVQDLRFEGADKAVRFPQRTVFLEFHVKLDLQAPMMCLNTELVH